MKKISSLFMICAFGIMLFPIACGDDSAVPSFLATVSADNTTFSEANGATSFTISLDVENNSGSSVLVGYSVGGTATAIEDYKILDGLVAIPDGSQSSVINVLAVDDTEDEPDETIIISLATSSNVIVGTSSTITLTITDNDEATAECLNDNSLNVVNTACTETPSASPMYNESVAGTTRTIVTNRIPDHDYGNQVPDMVTGGLTSTQVTLTMTTQPMLAESSTSILDDNFRPAYDFGVALNGVPIDPAPAEPFIFTNTTTNEFNWDWVFEPTNNRTAVGLDCNTAHLQPEMGGNTGLIHYHGDMAVYADDLEPGLGSGTMTPSDAVQIGWAADGFPIVYKYGPDSNGAFRILNSGYVLKSGDRGGDGESAPCGEYNGKYTNDYEYSSSAGDLDECNGIEQTITLPSGTFDYFYVITDGFPVIPRCISGTPGNDFRKMP